jgi:xylulokinase
MAHAVGIDVGSTNVKVVLTEASGLVVTSASRPLRTERDGDVSTQDPEALWEAVAGAVAELTAAEPDAAADVAAVGVCSQYSSIVPVDAEGTPVAELVMWSDQRGTDHAWDVLAKEGAFETFVEHHGIPPLGTGLSHGHLLHLQLDRPDVHERTAAWLEPMDYVNARLTGRLAANQATMFTSQVIDNRELGRTEYDDELVSLSGLDADRLPPLLALDEPVGALRDDVAARLGLPTGTVVYAGLSDTHTGAVATDATKPGRAGLAVGTTTVFIDAVDAKGEDLDHEILAMPSAFDDTYLVWAENGLGGRALEHVLAELFFPSDVLADHSGVDPFATLDEALLAVPPGAGGVLFLPWLGGALAPRSNPGMRGAFLNLSLTTGRADLVRAAAEGVAHNLQALVPHVEAFIGHEITEVAMVGGAARSSAWVGIFASVLGKPVSPVVGPDKAVARATALLALHRHGVLTRDDLSARVQVDDAAQPDPEAVAGYRHRQAQFEAAYDATQAISEALNT